MSAKSDFARLTRIIPALKRPLGKSGKMVVWDIAGTCIYCAETADDVRLMAIKI